MDIYDGGELPISTSRYERSLPKVDVTQNEPVKLAQALTSGEK